MTQFLTPKGTYTLIEYHRPPIALESASDAETLRSHLAACHRRFEWRVMRSRAGFVVACLGPRGLLGSINPLPEVQS